MDGFVAQAKTAVMHRDQFVGAELLKRTNRFFGVHMNFATTWRVVGSDGHEGNLHRAAFSDFGESIEIRCVAAMEDAAVANFNVESAKSAMRVVQYARAPMVAGSQADFEGANSHFFPIMELVDPVEAEVMDQVADFKGYDNGLIRCDGPQAATVKMVEVGVGDEDQIDVGQIVQVNAGVFDAFDDLEPARPVGIDEYIQPGSLDEKRGVADPGNADFVFPERGEGDDFRFSKAFREQGRQENLCEEVAFIPTFNRAETHAAFGGGLRRIGH